MKAQSGSSWARRALTVAGVAVVALLVLAPASRFAQLTVLKPVKHFPAVVAQTYVPAATPPADLTARLRSARSNPRYPPIVITYHNIAETGTYETVTPEAFAAQMRLLHDSGWHTLTAAQFEAWLHGGTVPPRSALLTFDDGPVGVYRYADPVLRHYNFHGIAFIITGWVGTHQPYYITWPELKLLHADGHWDLEAHTHLGHGFVASDAAGAREPFLSTTKWLPKQHRAETLAEYRTRVRSDLQQCIADLVGHGFPRPHLFAFPFSATGENAVGDALYSIVHSMFDAAFLDSSAGQATQLKEQLARQFRRVDTVRYESLSQYTQNIETSMQLPVFALGTTSWRRAAWVSTTGADVKLPAAGPVTLSVALTGDPYAEMHLDPYRTSFWTDYRVRAGFAGLRGEVGASLDVLLGSQDEFEVAVTSSDYRLYQGNGAGARLLQSGVLAASGPGHQVDLTVRPGRVAVGIDGQIVATVATNQSSRGGITVGGDPEHDSQAPQLDELSIARLSGS